MLVAHTDFSSRSAQLEISPKHPWIDFLRSRVSTIMDTASGMMAVTTGDSDMTVLMAGDSNVIDVIAEDSCMVAITVEDTGMASIMCQDSDITDVIAGNSGMVAITA